MTFMVLLQDFNLCCSSINKNLLRYEREDVFLVNVLAYANFPFITVSAEVNWFLCTRASVWLHTLMKICILSIQKLCEEGTYIWILFCPFTSNDVLYLCWLFPVWCLSSGTWQRGLSGCIFVSISFEILFLSIQKGDL